MPRVYKRITDREHKPRTRVKEDDRSAALTLIDAGLTTSQIEEQTGVSRSQIRRYKRNIRMWNAPSAPKTKAAGRPPKDAAAKAQREARAAASAIDDVVLPSQNEFPDPIAHDNSQSRIMELARIISTNTKSLDAYLRVHSLPQPSFVSDGPQHLLPQNAAALHAARRTILDATTELNDLLTPPPLLLQRPSNPGLIQLLTRHGLAQKVPLDSPIPLPDLAHACGLTPSDLRRLLKYGMAHHRLFTEPAPGLIAHSAASRLLLEPDTDAELIALDEVIRPAESRTLDVLTGTFDPSTQTQTSLLQRPALAAPLSRLLAPQNPALQTHPTDPLYTLLPYTVLPGMHIVDILPTSSPQSLARSLALADALPGTLLSLQFPAHAHDHVPVPEHLVSRVSATAFVGQPQALGADIYILRHLARASDEDVVHALRALQGGLRPGARIYICAPVLDDGEHEHEHEHGMGITAAKRASERELRAIAVHGVRVRSRDEWRALIAGADPRLDLGNVVAGLERPSHSGVRGSLGTREGVGEEMENVGEMSDSGVVEVVVAEGM